MDNLSGKPVLVVGLGASGLAASELLLKLGARVTAIDAADTPQLQENVLPLVQAGVEIKLGANGHVSGEFALAVVSPGVPLDQPLIENLRVQEVPLIGELELGWRNALCLSVGITGTNGKTTTTELVADLLRHSQRQTEAAGNIGTPVCKVVPHTRQLDVLTLEVSSFQLDTIDQFRPAVSVLTNLAPDHLNRYDSMENYIQSKARIFMNQRPFDWAVVQARALEQLRELGLEPPCKVITFSADNDDADLFLDRSLMVSRMPGWAGPLLDLEDCRLKGAHNAENLMAAMATGRVLGLTLEDMREALTGYEAQPHRCELVAEVDGVKFYNDSKATNVDALRRALEAMPEGPDGGKNIWLIAGGQDKEMHFHDAGPALSSRVREALLIGEASDKIRSAWSLFTTCTPVQTLADCVAVTRRKANPGDVVLLSPACASFDMFENYQARGDAFRALVMEQGENSASATYQQQVDKS